MFGSVEAELVWLRDQNGALREENVLAAAKNAELTVAVARLETANAEIVAANRLLLDRIERLETLEGVRWSV